ncbi:MAG: acetyltransferase [Acidimicrobiia bacterium]|nr:acetyltransferase [Acidimicrobiia bacterium]
MAEVTDNPAKSRFETTVEGHLAQLVYERHGQQFVLIHTEVPEELGGQGIGADLVKAALAVAQQENRAVVAECSYARTWIERHPDEVAGLKLEPARS